MGTTQPIRNRQELQNFSSYYKQVKPHLRNYTLVVLGLNTALRIQEKVSCHSCARPLATAHGSKGADPIVIMLIYNHSSFDITKRYLCIEQDDKDKIYRSILI